MSGPKWTEGWTSAMGRKLVDAKEGRRPWPRGSGPATPRRVISTTEVLSSVSIEPMELHEDAVLDGPWVEIRRAVDRLGTKATPRMKRQAKGLG